MTTSTKSLSVDTACPPFGQMASRIYASQILPFRHLPVQTVRPLPPTPTSAESRSEIPSSPISSKPLPTLPHSPISMPDISIIPATPLPSSPSSPKTFLSTGGNSIEAAMVSAPITLNSQRARHVPLRVCTAPEVLQRHSLSNSSSLTPTHSPVSTSPAPVSPLASDIPQPPSPTTARRRRLNKLQRHLGESIPPELVHSPSGRGRSLSITLGVSLDSSDSGGDLVFERSENLRAKDAGTDKVYDEFGSLSRFWRKCTQTSNQRIDVTRLVESDATDDEDDTSLGSGRGSDEYQWVVSRASKVEVAGTEARRAAHRYSKRWVREQGGRRWEEHDYNDVLKLLRKL
ncbi:hypothetical protein PC9H_000390 [Pleurotus ostreatus]|uniref:Uncharacterized protein n=1 Tax=Pleurotus ostreatus TaxID=5322 RepID=A0A8H7DXS2_PLEOS|nr:uncharacterized protein PC9H_000390 [Pleurotus ostreatus]KAF7440048.1 hypothetical protein PC9H_000390 [Pleurotus ostreatus]KAJ8700716.1 hypothetical protein PTI98_003714 [Pleurotus ostreatus]